MKTFRLTKGSATILRKRKKLKFTPVAVQIGQLPLKGKNDEAN